MIGTGKIGTGKMGSSKTKVLACVQARELLSPYLDGVVTGTEMLALQRHMEGCEKCAAEFRAMRETQRLLSQVPRPVVPADLGLKLRVAISREAAQARRMPFEGLMVRLDNALQAFMVPATAGFLSAVLIFGVAMAYFVAPSNLRGADNDVPLVMVNTAPELQPTALGLTMDTIDEDSLVIEAYVDQNGRVQDYRILSDSQNSKEVLPQVKRMLIFTTFRPALSMGRPTASRAVLSFSKISVKG